MVLRVTRRSRSPIASTCAVTCSLALVLSATARAQVPGGIALDRLDPAPAGDHLVVVPDPTVAPGFRPSAAVLGSYARNPLVVVRESGGDRDETGKLVSHQLVVHAMLAVDLLGTAKLSLDVPVTLSQAGESPAWDAAPTESPSGAAMNDLRGGLRLALIEQDGLLPAAATSVDAWFPTGDDASFNGSGQMGYAISLVTGADVESVLWRAAVGRKKRHDAGLVDGALGSEVFFAVGGMVRSGVVRVGPELFGATASDTGVDVFSRSSTHLEALVSGRARLGSIELGAGAGPGLTRGIGTPSFRVVASIGFVPEAPQRADRAQEARGSASRASPLPDGEGESEALVRSWKGDRDGDGVPDTADACPDVLGDARPDAPRRGCPPDGDGDGIPDMDDACPSVPGAPSPAPGRHGCPGDSDGDGVVDSVDACPREQGYATDDPATNGCPKSVRIEGAQIVILQKVQFATGSDVIESASDELLGEVAKVMADHPEIARVAVDGHTDDVGTERSNLALSRRRAVAVVRWLVAHGVDERRLEARGFGPRRPVVPNDGDEGRARNRRVEFQILRRTPKGEAGWKDGAADER